MNKTIAFVFLSLASFRAISCDCLQGSVESGMETSDLVFGAAVTGASVQGPEVVVEIGAFASIKGNPTPLKTLRTKLGSSACGFVVSVPERYIFFTRSDGTFDRCGATRLLMDPDVDELTSIVIRAWRKN